MSGFIWEDPLFYTTILFAVLTMFLTCICVVQIFITLSGLIFFLVILFCQKRATSSNRNHEDDVQSSSVEIITRNEEDEEGQNDEGEIELEIRNQSSSLLPFGSLKSDDGTCSILRRNYSEERKEELEIAGEQIKSILETLELNDYSDNFRESQIFLEEFLDLDGDVHSLTSLIPDVHHREYFSHFLSDSVQKIEYKENAEEVNMRTLDIVEILKNEAEKHHSSSPYSPSQFECSSNERIMDRKTKVENDYINNEEENDDDFRIIFKILKKLNLEMHAKKFSSISLEELLEYGGGQREDLVSLIPDFEGRATLQRFLKQSILRLEALEVGENNTSLEDVLLQVSSEISEMVSRNNNTELKRWATKFGDSERSNLRISTISYFPKRTNNLKQKILNRTKSNSTGERIKKKEALPSKIRKKTNDKGREIDVQYPYYKTSIDRAPPSISSPSITTDDDNHETDEDEEAPYILVNDPLCRLKYKRGEKEEKEDEQNEEDVFHPTDRSLDFDSSFVESPEKPKSDLPIIMSPTSPPIFLSHIQQNVPSRKSRETFELNMKLTSGEKDSRNSGKESPGHKVVGLFASSEKNKNNIDYNNNSSNKDDKKVGDPLGTGKKKEEGGMIEQDYSSQYCPIPQKDFNEEYIVKSGSVISQGSFGVVRLVYLDLGGTDELVKAVEKVIPITKINTREKIRNEVRILKMLKHPNLLNCFGSYSSNNCENIVLEFAEHGDLHRVKKMMTVRQRLSCVMQIVRGMKFLHSKGIVHRDLKTQNILISASGICRIGDFGASRNLQAMGSSVVGTCEYLAPEVIDSTLLPTTRRRLHTKKEKRKKKRREDNKEKVEDEEEEEEEEEEEDLHKELHKKVDIYAFGIILWELFSLRQPFLELRRKVNNNHFKMLSIIHKKKLRPDLGVVKDFNMKEILFLKRLMVKCWSHYPLNRPDSFESIENELLEKKIGGYEYFAL